jgi:hypothetical protein
MKDRTRFSTGWILAAVTTGAGWQSALPDTLIELGRFTSARQFRDVTVTGGDLFAVTAGLSGEGGAVRMMLGREQLTEMAAAELHGPQRVRVRDGRAYVLFNYYQGGLWRSGVEVYAVPTLERLSQGATWWNSATPGMDLLDDRVCLATANPTGRDTLGLQVYDLSDPRRPARIGGFPGIVEGLSVRVVDQTAYVADGLEGVKIIALTNPARPEQVGAWDPGPGKVVRDVAVQGRTLYAVGNGFWVLDIASPSAPRLLQTLEEEALTLTVVGDWAYVGGEGGLRLYHVRDPAHTAWTASYRNNAADAGPAKYPKVYGVEHVAPDRLYLADDNGLIVVRHEGEVQTTFSTALRQLDAGGAANLHAPLDPRNNPVPLLPRSDADILARQPLVEAGWVADGVTPLIVELEARQLTQPIAIGWATSVQGGQIAGGLDARVQVLADGRWTHASSVWLTPASPTLYLHLPALQPGDLSLAAGERELTVSLGFFDLAGDTGVGQEQVFLLRRPPVVLVSSVGTWTPEFLDVVRETRPLDFVLTEDHGLAVESTVERLRDTWALNRADCLAHGAGGLSVRGALMVVQPFRNEANRFRGWCRRIVTVGTPHNGTRLAPYLDALNQRLRGFPTARPALYPIPLFLARLTELMGQDPRPLANPRYPRRWDLDPLGFWVGQSLRRPHDPAAKFHFVGTRADPRTWRLFAFLGLTGQRLATVFPEGTDGVVDLESQVLREGVPYAQVVADPLAHLHAESAFGFASGQTASASLARYAMRVLDDPEEQPFASYDQPPLLGEAEAQAIRQAGDWEPLELMVEIAILGGRRVTGGAAPAAGFAEEIRCEFVPPVVAPVTGEVAWFVEAYAVGRPTTTGVEVEADLAQPSQAVVTVTPDVRGEVVVFASYPTTGDRRVYVRPRLLLRREPAGAVMTGLEVQPELDRLRPGEVIQPSLSAVYEDGSRRAVWVEPDEIQITSTAASVVDVSAPFAWVARAAGTATVRVVWNGQQADRTFTVVDPRAPWSYATWRASWFSPAELDDPQQTGPEVDRDGDQLGLLYEYVTGGDPRDWEAHRALWLESLPPEAPGDPALLVRIARHLAATEVTVERSTDLRTWSPYLPVGSGWNPSHELVRRVTDKGAWHEVALDPRLAGGTPAFFRLSVIPRE